MDQVVDCTVIHSLEMCCRSAGVKIEETFKFPDVEVGVMHKCGRGGGGGERDGDIDGDASPPAPYLTFGGSGLYYGGSCKNERCPAANQSIICDRGTGEFYPKEDVQSKVIKCPGCDGTFQPESFILFECKVKIQFVKQGGVHTEVEKVVEEDDYWELGLTTDAQDAQDNGVRYSPEYSYLKIIAKPL